MGAERQPGHALLARLESALYLRRHADHVKALDVPDLVIQTHATATREDHVDLLGLVVLVAEPLALAGVQHLIGEARLLGAQFLPREVCLAHLLEAELWGAVHRLCEVHQRVTHPATLARRVRPARPRESNRARARTPLLGLHRPDRMDPARLC